MDAENWGRKIRAFRKLKGYTQRGFAEAIGVSVSVLGEVERGSRKPDEELVKRILDELHITREDLLNMSQ